MGEKSNISWTDASWNPVTGCSKVSPGCQFCYAETLATRFGWTKHPWTDPYAAENVILKPQKLDLPLKWTEPRMVFVNSMSDLFHEQVPDDFIEEVFAVMALAHQHTFQVLTKRPERMAAFLNHDWRWTTIEGGAQRRYHERTGEDPEMWLSVKLPLPNVWLGTSVEDQRRADERIPHLLTAPAAVRFLSCEPLLGPLNLHDYLWESPGPEWAGENPAPGIDWIICGGESGSHLRDAAHTDRWMRPQWARDLKDQCVEAGVPFFMKQHSGFRPGQDAYIIERDGSHTEWHQFPER